MNKLKEKSKYIIGIIVTLLVLIFGLSNIVYGKTLTFAEFAHNPRYACIQHGGTLRSVTSDKYPLIIKLKGKYEYWVSATHNPDGTVKREGHWSGVDGNYSSVSKEKKYLGETITNYYNAGKNGNVDSTHSSEDWQRAVAFVLYNNAGWKSGTQYWIWEHVNEVINALGSSVEEPVDDPLILDPSKLYNAHNPISAMNTIGVSVGDPANDVEQDVEPPVNDGFENEDYNSSETMQEANKYANDGELGKYMEETKLPELKNKGDNPVKTDNAKWVGPFTIEYDDTNKNEDYEAIFSGNRPYGVSKLKVLTLEYLDGEKVSAPGITIRQNGTTFTDPNKIEKNVPFEIENLNPEKEVVNVHIELEKWMTTFFVNGQVWSGDKAEVDESRVKELIQELTEKFKSENKDKQNFSVEVEDIKQPNYIPQHPIEITKLKIRAEKITLTLDIPVEVKKGGIGIEKKGVYNGQEENLAGITFKLYCDTVGKYVKDIKPNAKSLTGTEIEFTEKFDEAKPWVTGKDGKLLIDGLFAGEDYTYKLIETDGGDNHYYDDPLKLSEAKGYTLGHIEQDGKKYCTVEGIKVKEDKKDLIEIIIKDDRTSGDLSIDKYDEKDESSKLKGAKFKIQLVRSESSDAEHDLKLENKWLIPNGSAGNYDYTNMKHDEYLSDTEEVGEFVADENGHIDIKCIINGTYHVYETEGYWGYDIEGQDNDEHKYDPEKHWVDIGEVTVSKDSNHIVYGIPNIKTRGDLDILKSDSKHGKALENAEFKIFLQEDKAEIRGKDVGAKGWLKNIDKNYYLETKFSDFLTENINDAGTFKTDKNGKIHLEGIPLGRYEIYETTGSIGYDIEGQHGKEHEYVPDKNWTYFGTIDVTDGYGINEFKLENDISRGNLAVEKTDSVFEELPLAGVEFKIYLEDSQDYGAKGWLKNIDKNYYLETHFKEFLTENENDAGTFITDENGKINIEGIPNGTYHIYETKMPKGYYMEAQDGYDSSKKWVDLGIIVVDSFKEEGSGERPTVQYQVGERNTDTKIQNRKILGPDGLTGFVWIDEPDTTKVGLSKDSYDSLYGSGDTVLEGIKVTLYNEEGKVIARTVTEKDGRYHILKWDSESDKNLHVDPERDDLYFWDLVNAYIEFVYDNKTYVCVNPFEGGKEKVEVNSKAQEYSLSKEELDDTKLTGAEGELSGKAVTKQHGEAGMSAHEIEITKYTSGELSSHGLTAYYNDDNFTVENINLGLWRKIEPTYRIQETLEYSKVLMNGYTYTYDYVDGDNTYGYADSSMIPSTYEQVSATYYGAKVYPSDIAYTAEGKPNGMEMYVVYKITVENNTTHQIPNIYDELRLYLTSLTDTFDSARYKLSTEQVGSDKWEGSQYFGLWEEKDGTASYKISEDVNVEGGDQINDGIVPGNSESVYIRFQVQQGFLEDMLAGTLTDERMNGAVTQAHATGHHAYKRTDNVWSKDESDKYYADSKARDQEEIQNEFLHRSVDVTNDAGALCLLFVLGEERTISGTVYEDTVTEESTEANENIGNGILDSEEGNRASGVKVELIDASTLGTEGIDHHAVLYQHTENSPKGYEVVSEENTILYTNTGGYYEFKGVVPGLYIIKLTYSDGSQKMVGTDGSEIGEITSNDYKSTIINTTEAENLIKDAMETKLVDMENYINIYKDKSMNSELRESAQKIIEWYKYLYEKDPNNQYNIATDDFETRSNFTNYEYSNADGTTVVTDGNGVVVSKFPEITSSTPYFSISIENDIEDYSLVGTYEDGYAHSPKYERFDLGLIKTTETNLILNKIISDVKLTNSVGTVLVQGDPREALNYVTALDNLPTGSQYTRVEMELDNLYGTEVETTYRVKIDNSSVKDYIEDREHEHYGYYFKYGDKSNAHLKRTKVTEVIDLVDGDYDVLNSSVEERVAHPEESEHIGEETSNVTMTVEAENESRCLKFGDWEGIESGGWTQIEYRANGLFQEDRDLTYDNSARITRMKLDLGATLRTDYVWGDFSRTRIVATPDTGGDRRPIYIVCGVIALIVIATGIVVIKKGILK